MIQSMPGRATALETIMAKTKWSVIYNADAFSLSDMLRFAPMAEQAGTESIWTAEAWRDAFVPLTAMAGTVKTVRVGTGIAQMARPPCADSVKRTGVG
jgi:alkanesulfonate monooxygenase SsuD/methylene tetrahydromethanopterin reductase-like flavin-dependent oxidoreductase (luciferase family)